MTTKTTGAAELPEALRLAKCLERDCEMNWPDYDNQMDAAAELRRLHAQASALSAAQAGVPAWINPCDKSQERYLPDIGEAVLFKHEGRVYTGKHTGGSFKSDFPLGKHFDTWDCVWVYPSVLDALAAAPQPSPSPAPAQPGQDGERINERTPTDYAIEHAEYLAASAERLIDAVHANAQVQLRIAEWDDVPDDIEQDSRDDVDEALRSVRERIYEFRKRRDRAARAAPQPATADAVDAQRYRWLRHGDNDEKVLCNGPVAKDYWYLLRGEKLDAAIDAAQRGVKP